MMVYNLQCSNGYIYFTNYQADDLYKYSINDKTLTLICNYYSSGTAMYVSAVENNNFYGIVSDYGTDKLLMFKYNSETDTYTLSSKSLDNLYVTYFMNCKNGIIYASAINNNNYYVYVYDTNNISSSLITLSIIDEIVNLTSDDNYLYVLTKSNNTYTIKRYDLSVLTDPPITYYTSNNKLRLCDNYIIECNNTANTVITVYNITTLQQETSKSYNRQINVYKSYYYDNNVIIIHKSNDIPYIIINNIEFMIDVEKIEFFDYYNYEVYKSNTNEYTLLQLNYDDGEGSFYVNSNYLLIQIQDLYTNINFSNNNFNITYNNEDINNASSGIQLSNNEIKLKGEVFTFNLTCGEIENEVEEVYNLNRLLGYENVRLYDNNFIYYVYYNETEGCSELHKYDIFNRPDEDVKVCILSSNITSLDNFLDFVKIDNKIYGLHNNNEDLEGETEYNSYILIDETTGSCSYHSFVINDPDHPDSGYDTITYKPYFLKKYIKDENNKQVIILLDKRLTLNNETTILTYVYTIDHTSISNTNFVCIPRDNNDYTTLNSLIYENNFYIFTFLDNYDDKIYYSKINLDNLSGGYVNSYVVAPDIEEISCGMIINGNYLYLLLQNEDYYIYIYNINTNVLIKRIQVEYEIKNIHTHNPLFINSKNDIYFYNEIDKVYILNNNRIIKILDLSELTDTNDIANVCMFNYADNKVLIYIGHDNFNSNKSKLENNNGNNSENNNGINLENNSGNKLEINSGINSGNKLEINSGNKLENNSGNKLENNSGINSGNSKKSIKNPKNVINDDNYIIYRALSNSEYIKLNKDELNIYDRYIYNKNSFNVNNCEIKLSNIDTNTYTNILTLGSSIIKSNDHIDLFYDSGNNSYTINDNENNKGLRINSSGITVKGTLTLTTGTISSAASNNNDIVNKQYFDDNSVGKKEYIDGNLKGEIFNTYTGDNKNIASGSRSHAEGCKTTASGFYSHAEVYKTTASGDYSHAEGYQTKASGGSSHAEGSNTTASNNNSHAEGNNTTASGYNSHAEGYQTTASSQSSHAEGYYTTASAHSSHAEGYYTVANKQSMTAIGKYNVSDSSLNTGKLFAVGNGTANNARSDAFVVKNDGSAYVNGVLNVSNNPSINTENLMLVKNGKNNIDSDAFVIKNDGNTYVNNILNINSEINNISSVFINKYLDIIDKDTILIDNSYTRTFHSSISSFSYMLLNEQFISAKYNNSDGKIHVYHKDYNSTSNAQERNSYSKTLVSDDMYVTNIWASHRYFMIKSESSLYFDNAIYQDITYRHNFSSSSIYVNNSSVSYSNLHITNVMYAHATNQSNVDFICKCTIDHDNATHNYIMLLRTPASASGTVYGYTCSEIETYLNNNCEITFQRCVNDENRFYTVCAYDSTNDQTVLLKYDNGNYTDNYKTYKGYAAVSFYRYDSNSWITKLYNVYSINSYLYKVSIFNIDKSDNTDIVIDDNPEKIYYINKENYTFDIKNSFYSGLFYIVCTDQDSNKYVNCYYSSNVYKKVSFSYSNYELLKTMELRFYIKNSYFAVLLNKDNNNDYKVINITVNRNQIYTDNNDLVLSSNNNIVHNSITRFYGNVYMGNSSSAIHTYSQSSSKLIKNEEQEENLEEKTLLSSCNSNNIIYSLYLLNSSLNYVIYSFKSYNEKPEILKELSREDYPGLNEIFTFNSYYNSYLLVSSNNGIYYINLSKNQEIIKLLEDNNINKIIIDPRNNNYFYVLYNSYDYYSSYDYELNKTDYHLFTSENCYSNKDLDLINMIFYENNVYFIHNLIEDNNTYYIVFSVYNEITNNVIERRQFNSITFTNEYYIIDNYCYENYVYFLITKNGSNIELIKINKNNLSDYNVYDNVINDNIIKYNKNIYYLYNSEYFYLVSNNYIYYYNVSDNLVTLENKLYAEGCKYITNEQDLYITNDNISSITNNTVINGDILLNGQIKTSTINAAQINISEMDVNVNKTIIHNTLIYGEINSYEVGNPVFIKEGNVYILQRKSNDGKYPVYEYIEVNDNTYVQNSINQIPKITYENNGKFIGVITAIYPANTPLKINEITSNYIKINNDTIDFATHGDYIFKVINNIEHQTTKKINETDYETKLYQIGDKLLYDGTIIDPDTPITSRLLSNCIGTITYIPENNVNYVSVFKS